MRAASHKINSYEQFDVLVVLPHCGLDGRRGVIAPKSVALAGNAHEGELVQEEIAMVQHSKQKCATEKGVVQVQQLTAELKDNMDHHLWVRIGVALILSCRIVICAYRLDTDSIFALFDDNSSTKRLNTIGFARIAIKLTYHKSSFAYSHVSQLFSLEAAGRPYGIRSPANLIQLQLMTTHSFAQYFVPPSIGGCGECPMPVCHPQPRPSCPPQQFHMCPPPPPCPPS
ncbi:hypothetical protein DICVIV_08977 [Dictyocaulus viviparus]|uniref:Uncharacterized protein n=1 Tax=Dictyocaulus viviparus TaxID=29172 RepID=A0A0D8XK66_DICVI|nr:hypothetical protein DICVIV_08977 [Dictyocaulus viviparus]